MKTKPIAVVFSGCGCLDGSEPQEGVLTLLSLTRAGADHQCLALDEMQSEVCNHITGEPMGGERSILLEAARIARGEIKSLEDTHADEFSAVIFIGGFGNGIHYSDFLEKREQCTVHPKIVAWAKPFANDRKPMGFMCLAPVLVPAICGPGVKVTLGMASDMSEAIEAMGARHVVCESSEICVDAVHQVVSAPLYMTSSNVAEVANGIDRLVNRVVLMTNHMHLGVS